MLSTFLLHIFIIKYFPCTTKPHKKMNCSENYQIVTPLYLYFTMQNTNNLLRVHHSMTLLKCIWDFNFTLNFFGLIIQLLFHMHVRFLPFILNFVRLIVHLFFQMHLKFSLYLKLLRTNYTIILLNICDIFITFNPNLLKVNCFFKCT
jgi:hypothetical protein